MNSDLKTTFLRFTIGILFLFPSLVLGQSGISLYHLGNSTFQGNHFNPAFMPEGKVFVGLPVLSGIMLDYNGRVNYRDAITTNQDGEKQYDIDKFVADAKKRNYISLEAEISTLYVGWRKSKSLGFSFFVRERIGARGFYSDQLVNTAWHGNSLGSKVDLKGTALDLRYYREYGFGIWKSIPKRGINIGVRAKLLNGMVSAVTNNKLKGSVGFEEDNSQANFNLTNAVINTSGLTVLEDDSLSLSSHLISNSNLGAGIDIGAHWKINRYLSAAVSVNDLGFIRWKVDPKNYQLADTTFRFEGIDITDIGNFKDAYLDSLKNRLQDTTLHQAYTTGLNTTSYASLMYQLSPNDRITGSIAAHVVQGNFRMIYSAAYTRRFGKGLDISANVSRIPQQGVDVGVAAAVNLGAVQMYLASDKLLHVWDVTKIDAVDLRFGINLVFGDRGKSVKEDNSDLNHPSPFGKKEKVEKSDGIYWIIRKKHPRPVYEKTKFRDT